MVTGQITEGEAQRRGITRAAGVLGGLTLISRISGLVRDIVISAVFGASTGADAFFVAFRIPNLFRRVVGEGAASAAFVPVFTEELVSHGREETLRASQAVGAAAIAVLTAVVLSGVVLAEPLVSVFAPGFAADPAKRELTVSLTRFTFPYLLFVGAAAWAMGSLHTFKRFVAPALGPILLNLAIVTAAVLLSRRIEPAAFALVIGVLVGGFLQFAVQLPSLRGLGLRFRERPQFSHRAVGRVGRLLVPVIFGGAVYQVNILVATVFASLLPERSVSYLWYADRVFEFPLGLVAVAVGTAALPTLSGQAKAGERAEMGRTVGHSLSLTWALCIPAGVGLWILAPAIVQMLFERGRFTGQDTVNTAWALRAYVFGILGVGAARVLSSAFYAMERPRIPVYAAVVALFTNALFDLALMGPISPSLSWWGASVVNYVGDLVRIADLRHAGLALSTGIAASVNAVLLLVILRLTLPELGLRAVARSMAVHCLSAAVMGALLYGGIAALPSSDSATAAVKLAAGLSLGIAVYVATAFLLGSTEVREIVTAVARRLRRP